MAFFSRFSKRPPGHREEITDHHMAEILREQIRITDFIARKDLVGKMHDANNRRLLLLNIHNSNVDPVILDKHLNQRLRAEATTCVLNNCFEVALDSVSDGSSTGILETRKGAQELARWTNHRINYDALPDGSVLAVDLTARENMSTGNESQFDVLALRAANLGELKARLGELYGGDWQEVRPDDY